MIKKLTKRWSDYRFKKKAEAACKIIASNGEHREFQWRWDRFPRIALSLLWWCLKNAANFSFFKESSEFQHPFYRVIFVLFLPSIYIFQLIVTLGVNWDLLKLSLYVSKDSDPGFSYKIIGPLQFNYYPPIKPEFTYRDDQAEIAALPPHPSGFQRSYIDEFLQAKEAGAPYFIEGRKVVDATYGHCMDYPKGFYVTFERDGRLLSAGEPT